MRAVRRPSLGGWILPAGLGAVLMLIAAVAVFSSVQSRRVFLTDAVIDREAERSAYLVGHIGELLARLWAETLDTTTENGAALDPIVKSIHELDHQLDNDLGELPTQLSGRAAQGFAAIAPDIAALRHRLDDALTARLGESRAEAETILDDVEEAHERVSRELQQAAELTHDENIAELTRTEHAMESVRVVQAIAFALLFASTLAIAVAVMGLIRRQREQLAAHVAAVEHANLDLEAFAGRVAHDLKNILAPIGLSVPLLRRPNMKPEALADVAGRIDRASRRAVDLLEGLLAFARAGAPADGGERASPAVELEGVLEELAGNIDRVGADITHDVDREIEVRCSPALLHVVLLNLIGNAVKFLEGRDERRVHIRVRRAGRGCAIDIVDTGPGVAAAVRERIFEPFYRAPRVTAAGTGMGLATVRRVVDAYGGSVSVQSIEGHGATFHVELPLAPRRENERRDAGEAAVATTSSAPTAPSRARVNT